MGHNITAIILKGDYDKEAAKEYDLRGVNLKYNLTMFPIDIYYTAYWQYSLELHKHLAISPPLELLVPTEGVIGHLVETISTSNSNYILIHTECFGAAGKQYAAILQGLHCIGERSSINEALRLLDVPTEDEIDEFDRIGLSEFRTPPSYLEKYRDLCDELGL